MHDAFLYISWSSLHDYDVKLPYVTFYVERELKDNCFLFVFFLTQKQTIRILLQKKLVDISQIERDGVVTSDEKYSF